jgi:hypothetical protein
MQPDVPGALEHLLGKLLQKRPEDRPQSISDLVRTFEVLGGGALATGPLAPTGMGEALPAPSFGAHGGFAPARGAQASSAQSFVRSSANGATASGGPAAEALAPNTIGHAAVAEAPRYSEPPRKKRMPVWLILFFAIVAAAVVAAVVLNAR